MEKWVCEMQEGKFGDGGGGGGALIPVASGWQARRLIWKERCNQCSEVDRAPASVVLFFPWGRVRARLEFGPNLGAIINGNPGVGGG